MERKLNDDVFEKNFVDFVLNMIIFKLNDIMINFVGIY